MDDTARKYQDLRNMLLQRASAVMGESMLKAFIEHLDGYENSFLATLENGRNEALNLKNENDLLRNLVGASDEKIKSKLLEQGQEINFLRGQLIGINRQLEEAGKTGDSLKLELEQENNEIKKYRNLLEEEQNKFDKNLMGIRRQMTELEQKVRSKELELEREKEKMSHKFDEDVREIYLTAEKELEAVGAKFCNLARSANDSSELCLKKLEKYEQESASKKKRSVFARFKADKDIVSELLPDIKSVFEWNNMFLESITGYLKILGQDNVQEGKIAWNDFWNELKKRITNPPLSKNIKIIWPAHDGSKSIFTDKTKFIEVCEAVIRNGIEALRDGGTLEITSLFGSEKVNVIFSNDGKLIKAGETEKIFLPFYSTKPGHIGLGLTKALRFMRILGGSIDVEQKSGKVSFPVSLPIKMC